MENVLNFISDWRSDFVYHCYLRQESTRKRYHYLSTFLQVTQNYTGSSKKMDWIWNRYNLKSTGRIYTFGILKCSETFKVLDLP